MNKTLARTTRFCGVATFTFLNSVSLAQQADNRETQDSSLLEEVTVTGSRIIGNENSTSAVVSLDLEEQYFNPSVTVSEFLRENVTANYGQEVFADEGLGVGRTNGNRVAGPNLWGLGEENTLTLLNGSRVALNGLPSGRGWFNTDINAIIPSIAIQRTDVLLDGGSAIYGTDAVAGVVNLIPRYNFKGFEVRGQAEFFPEDVSSSGSQNLEAIWGTGFGEEKGSFVIAGNYTNTNLYDAEAVGLTAQNTPQFTSPITDADIGADPGQILAGSAYGNYGGGRGRDADPRLTDPLCGATDLLTNQDYWELGEIAPPGLEEARAGECLRYPPPVLDGRDSTRWTLYSAVKFDLNESWSLSAEISRHEREQYDLIRFGDVRATRVRNDIPANHPGIVYNQSISPVWAEADLGSSLFYGSSIERPVGFQTEQEYTSETTFAKIAADWTINENLQLQLSAVYGDSDTTHSQHRAQKDRYSNALAGLGGPGCDPLTGTPGEGACQYFNPFLNALLPNAADLGLANSPELMQWLFPANEAVRNGESILTAVDALLNFTTGITLPGGPISGAVGASRIEEENTLQYAQGFTDAAYLGLDSALEDFNGTRVNKAAFAEFLFPITDNFELQVAGRYDDYSDIGDTFNPKVGFVWDFNERVSIRSSWGTSFKAPSVLHTEPNVITLSFPPEPTGGRNQPRTPLSGISGPLGGSIEPQEAEVFSVGGEFGLVENWKAVENIGLKMSYVNIEFDDQIGFLAERSRVPVVQQPGVSALGDCGRTTGSSFDGLREVGFDTNSPCFEFSTEAAPIGTDPRDGANLFAADDLTTAYRLYTNFDGASIEGLDMQLSTMTNTPLGRLQADLRMTYMIEYLAGQAGGVDGVVDVVGVAGATGGANQDIPEFVFVIPLRMFWEGGNHVSSLTTRHITEIRNPDGTMNTEALTTVDFQHNWQFLENASVSLTVRNLFEEEPVRPGDPLLLPREGVRTFFLNFAYAY